MIQSPPFFSARVRRPATSEPPAGSENSWHQIFSPDASGGRYSPLLLLAGERHHGRPAHAVADDEHAAELAERALFLLPDHALDRRRAAPAIFLRPVQAGPAGIGLLLLPGLCDLEDVGALELGAAERGFAQFLLILLRRVGRDPGFGLGAERGFLRGVVEVHARRPCSSFRMGRASQMIRNPRMFSGLGIWVRASRDPSDGHYYAAFLLRMRSISASSQ